MSVLEVFVFVRAEAKLDGTQLTAMKINNFQKLKKNCYSRIALSALMLSVAIRKAI